MELSSHHSDEENGLRLPIRLHAGWMRHPSAGCPKGIVCFFLQHKAESAVVGRYSLGAWLLSVCALLPARDNGSGVEGLARSTDGPSVWWWVPGTAATTASPVSK